VSALASYRVDVEDVRTGLPADSITTSAASPDEARRYAEYLIRQKPNLRIVRVHHASVTIAGEGTMTADVQMVRLYDTDILLWSERQAALLRQRAELVNDAGIDWLNVAEEIEDVGRSAVNAVMSSLENILRHRTYLLGWPNSPACFKWRTELKAFARTLRRNYTPSMTGTGKVTEADLREIYADAVEYSIAHMDAPPEIEIPAECPWTLSEMIAYSTGQVD
jgi:uncharacterized protein DUF29